MTTDRPDTSNSQARPTSAKSELLLAAAAAAARYVETERDVPAAPHPAAIEALGAFGEMSIDAPIEPAAAIELLATVGSDATMRSTGGRYFGFVNGGVAPVALAASVLASAWDQNAALPAMSPTASALDDIAASWMVDILGLPPTASAAFCGGASIANLTAIVTARDALLARSGWDVHAHGLNGAPRLSVITSAEAHVSVTKAVRIAGLGHDDVHMVRTDEHGAMIADAMPDLEGLVLVLLQAGNVNTGHSDPFDAIIDRLDASRSWVHVDGAFGLWANAAPARKHTVAGVERADSWATDGHKWLNAPYDCGLVVIADGQHLRSAMRADAAYVPTADDQRANLTMGLQMSQAARAIPVWAILATAGRSGVAEWVEHCCRCAEAFATQLEAAGVEVLAPVAINQLLVAFGDDATTDAVIDAVQRDGTCWMGGTTWQGRQAMRISVSDVSTTLADVDASVAAVLRAWESTRPLGI